jgi:hypothetical protein
LLLDKLILRPATRWFYLRICRWLLKRFAMCWWAIGAQ